MGYGIKYLLIIVMILAQLGGFIYIFVDLSRVLGFVIVFVISLVLLITILVLERKKFEN